MSVNNDGKFIANRININQSLTVEDISCQLHKLNQSEASQKIEIVTIIKDRSGNVLAYCKIPSVQTFGIEDSINRASDVLAFITTIVNNMGMKMSDIIIEIIKINKPVYKVVE